MVAKNVQLAEKGKTKTQIKGQGREKCSLCQMPKSKKPSSPFFDNYKSNFILKIT